MTIKPIPQLNSHPHWNASRYESKMRCDFKTVNSVNFDFALSFRSDIDGPIFHHNASVLRDPQLSRPEYKKSSNYLSTSLP